MSELVQAEYEARWDCPKCGELTTGGDDNHIINDNDGRLTIKCAHDVDIGDFDFSQCGHEYEVNLRT